MLLLVLIGLAAYRFTRLLIEDDLLAAPREWLLPRLPPFLERGFMCFWCLGAWVSISTVLITDLFLSVPAPVLTIAASSAIVGLIHEHAAS